MRGDAGASSLSSLEKTGRYGAKRGQAVETIGRMDSRGHEGRGAISPWARETATTQHLRHARKLWVGKLEFLANAGPTVSVLSTL